MRYVFAAIVLTLATPVVAETVRVGDATALATAAQQARPGDTIVIVDGVWRDRIVTIHARGAGGRPVTILPETPGGLVLSGRSALAIGGAHVVVGGIAFRDGLGAGPALVTVRDDAQDVTIRDVVVDRFGHADRHQARPWVLMAGRDGALLYSRFVGKGDVGATVLVTGTGNRIVHNHFADRPMPGAPGGETIRIAASAEDAVIEHNLVEDCTGDARLIALEGLFPTVRSNLIRRSAGAIVIGGGGARIEGNVIRGDGQLRTGGIRVAAAGAIINDNYLERLAAPAIAVDAGGSGQIMRNSIIDAARVTFAEGAERVRFADNLLRTTLDPFRFTGAASRIVFSGNRSSFAPPAAVGTGVVRDTRDFIATPAGLLRLPDGGAGAAADLAPFDPADAGPEWARRTPRAVPPPKGRTVTVPPGDLSAAVRRMAPGDRIRLTAGTYRAAAAMPIDRAITIIGPASARIRVAAPTAFQLAAGGSLTLTGVTVSGIDAPARPGNAIVRAPLSTAAGNYRVMLDDVTVEGLARPGFDVVATTPGSFADAIDIRLSRFSNIGGAIVSAGGNGGSRYRAALVRIAKSTIVRAARGIDVTRTPGAGFGPVVEITDTQFDRVGSPTIRLTGAESVVVADTRFTRAGALQITGQARDAIATLRCNAFIATAQPIVDPPAPTIAPAPDWRAALPCGTAGR